MTQAHLIIYSGHSLALSRQINKALVNMASFIIFFLLSLIPLKKRELNELNEAHMIDTDICDNK